MKINLYDFLDFVGFIEVNVEERLDNGKDRPLCIGYPEELKEHLKLAFSTTRYEVIYLQEVRNDMLTVIVIEN